MNFPYTESILMTLLCIIIFFSHIRKNNQESASFQAGTICGIWLVCIWVWFRDHLIFI